MKEVTKKIVMTFMTVILVMGLMTAGTGILRVEAAKKVKLSVKKKTIDQDQSFTILVKNAKGKIKWSTSNDKIVSIKKINNKKYKVTGVSAGKAVVAVKVKNKTYKCNVTVRGLTTIKKTLDINEKTVIEAKNVGKNVKWSISNGKIATIKKLNGTKCEITGVSAGKTMVTAKVGKKKYTCAIVVSKKENTSSGVGIANVTISKEGNLVLTYTDGTVVTMDKVVGTIDVGMVKVELTADNMLKFTFADGSVQTVGPIKGETGPGVVNCYVDENYHLWIELSNGEKIDAGYVGVTLDGDATTRKYTVVFKDYDGTVLKTEEVKQGEAATPPSNPIRNGFEFVGWDSDFGNITSNIVVTAKYTENTKPVIQVSKVSAKAGESVRVPVLIKNNPGIAGATLTVTYVSGLILTNAENGEAFATLTYSNPGKFVSPCNFTWDSESGETKENGTILYLTFTVPNTASSGEVFEISCSYRNGDIFNDAWDDVMLTTISGEVTVY